MADISYSNRELDSKFEHLGSLLIERFDDLSIVMARVEIQTTKTNGRVNSLETKDAERRGAGRWIIAIGGFVCSVLVAYLGYLGMQLNTIQTTMQTTVQAAVTQALLPYAHK